MGGAKFQLFADGNPIVFHDAARNAWLNVGEGAQAATFTADRHVMLKATWDNKLNVATIKFNGRPNGLKQVSFTDDGGWMRCCYKTEDYEPVLGFVPVGVNKVKIVNLGYEAHHLGKFAKPMGGKL